MSDRHDMSIEPMEIDLSEQSLSAMDISYNVSDNYLNSSINPTSPRSSIYSSEDFLPQLDKTIEQPTIKYCHINIKKNRVHRRYLKLTFKLLFAALVALASITIYYINNVKCCDQINFKILNETLLKKLYGQSIAANVLIEALELKHSKILFFSGGTGVGKTFTSSLLLDFVGPCSNVYHYTMPTFNNTFSPDTMFGITVCKSSIVVVDDLTIDNMYVKEHIKNLIMKSENVNKEITVILIYNCNENHLSYFSNCDKFNDKIMDSFSEIKVLKKIIQFEPLSVNILKQCIVQELGKRKINDLQFEALLKNFNVSVDGCKGVHSKMKYLNIL